MLHIKKDGCMTDGFHGNHLNLEFYLLDKLFRPKTCKLYGKIVVES